MREATPSEITEKMRAGFRAARGRYLESGLACLQKGALPREHTRALVIACSDSRVDPALLFGFDLGEVFMIRNVANLVPPYEPDSTTSHGVSAAIEYAVRALEVEAIIIFGHSNCGGINALLHMDEHGGGDFIGHWLSMASDIRREVDAVPGLSHEARIELAEKRSIMRSLDNLRTFPWIREREERGLLRLHGWYFTIDTFHLEGYNSGSGEFESIFTE